MKRIQQASATILLALIFGPAAAQAPAPASPSEPARAPQPRQASERDTRREDMRREVAEAATAIGAYSQAERDQALQRAKSALDAMDRRIESTQRGWVNDAERRSARAHEDRERLLADLRKQRAEAAERYRAMQDASADTWERVRTQFLASYKSLAEQVRRLWDSADEAAPAGKEPAQPAEPEEAGKRDR